MTSQLKHICSRQKSYNFSQILTHLCAVVSFFLDENGCFQIVVPTGPEGSLDEGTTFNSCLDLGQRQVFWI